jgi:penicillin-binding protein 2
MQRQPEAAAAGCAQRLDALHDDGAAGISDHEAYPPARRAIGADAADEADVREATFDGIEARPKYESLEGDEDASCNVYFYTLGNLLGVDRIHKWASLLGLGERNNIDLPNEVRGLVPSTEWKRQVMKDKWYAGETISVAIGQGQVNVTPLSLAVMMMTLANGGTRYTPHVLKAMDEGKGWTPLTPPAPLSTAPMKASTVQAVHDGLWLAVNGAGTAGRARIEGRDVSGKTGTAQVISLTGAKVAKGKIDVRDHGWFVFFAPRDKPELAGVIFLEHAEHGYYGGSIAKHIIETYYAKKEGRPLPVLQKPVPPGTVIAAAAAAPATQQVSR